MNIMSELIPENIIKEVLAKLDPLKVLKLIDYRTDTIQKSEGSVRCFCPIHNELVFRTLVIDIKKKNYRCSYTLCPGKKGGDLIGLYAQTQSIEYDEALHKLVKALNIDVELPTPQEFINKNIEIAENYLALNELEEAEKCFKKILSLQAHNIRALNGLISLYSQLNQKAELGKYLDTLTDIYFNNKDYESVSNLLEIIVNNLPDDIELRTKIAEKYFEANEKDMAITTYLSIVDYYDSQKKFEKSIEIYRKIDNLGYDAIDIYSLIIQAYNVMGDKVGVINEHIRFAEKSLSEGKLDSAISGYESVLELDNARNDIRTKIIDIYCQKGLTETLVEKCLTIINELISLDAIDDALVSLDKVNQTLPDNVEIISKLIEAYKLQRNIDKELEFTYKLAEILYQSHRQDESIQKLKYIVDKKPEDLKTLTFLARIYQELQDKQNAIYYYKTIAKFYQNNNQLNDAINIYQTIIDMAPDETDNQEEQIELIKKSGNPELAFEKSQNLSNLFISKGDNKKAIEYLEYSLSIKPDNIETSLLLAQTFEHNNQIDKAINIYMSMADNYIKSNNKSSAIDTYNKIINIQPDNIRVIHNLSLLHCDIGEIDKALKDFERLLNIYEKQNDRENAIIILKKITEINPDDVDVMIKLASLYDKTAQIENRNATYKKITEHYYKNDSHLKCIDFCRNALEKDKDNLILLESLAQVYEKINRKKELIDTYSRIAEVYQNLNIRENERKYYELILKVDESLVDVRNKLIMVLTQLNEFDKVITEFDKQYTLYKKGNKLVELFNFAEEIFKIKSDFIELHKYLINKYEETGSIVDFVSQSTSLIEIYQQKGKHSEAIELFLKILQVEPENVQIRINFIDTLITAGENSRAVEQYFVLANQYESRKAIDDAKQIYEEIIKIDEKNVEARKKLIRIHIEKNNFVNATEEIFELSQILINAEKYNEAIDVINGVFSFDSKNIQSHKKLIEIYSLLNNKELAVKEYNILVDIYINANDCPNAISLVTEAINLFPDEIDLMEKLADIYLKDNKVDSAVKTLYNTVDKLTQTERHKEAIPILSKIIEIKPKSSKAKRLKAELYAKVGEDKKALEEFLEFSKNLEKYDSDEEAIATKRIRITEDIKLKLVSHYTFDNFVIGDGNNFAQATAMAIAKAPAKNYNPLFLYSDVGLGKTHLVNAIGNQLLQNNPDINLLYTNTEEFTTELIEAIQNNTINTFRNHYKNIDVLIIEDIQFIAGKERAQEEFFHIFNTLFQSRKQIIITCDRPPKDIAHLEKRLKSRFGGGIIVDIKAPEIETRVAILKKDLENYNIPIKEEIIYLLAEKVKSNIRELKGALNRIVANYQLTGKEITSEDVIKIVNTLFEELGQ